MHTGHSEQWKPNHECRFLHSSTKQTRGAQEAQRITIYHDNSTLLSPAKVIHVLERILLGGIRPRDRLQSLGVGVRASEAALQPRWTSLTNAYTHQTRVDSSQVVDVSNRTGRTKNHTSHFSHSVATTLRIPYRRHR